MMVSLADEIARNVSIFSPVNCDASFGEGVPAFLSRISQGKNGVSALSGALIIFGCDRACGPLSVWRYNGRWRERDRYRSLVESDFIFGCDVFGDLLFYRSGCFYRLDGELDDIELLFEGVADFESISVSEASDMFGGRPARDAFGGGVLGEDPLRLMPVVPFAIACGEGQRYQHRIIALSDLIDKKAILVEKIRQVNDGEVLDLDFW